MAEVDRSEVAAGWLARGFSCDLWLDAVGQCWEDFTHETDEVVTVLEGEMEFDVEGVVSRPKVGEELVIPAGAVHSARNVGKNTARWLYGYRRSWSCTKTRSRGSKTARRGCDSWRGHGMACPYIAASGCRLLFG